MTLPQISRMITFGLPVFGPSKQMARTGEQYRLVLIAIRLAFLLALPSQVIAPLAAGSITWFPVVQHTKSPTTVDIQAHSSS